MAEYPLLDKLIEHTAAWNAHDIDRLMALFADDCAFEASGGPEVCGRRFEGKDDVRAAFLDVFERMPDAHWGGGTHRVIGDDYGVSEWTLTGTLADGGHVEVNGCDFLSFREGQIVLKNSYRKQRPALHITR